MNYLVNTEQRFILNQITSTWLYAIPYRTEHETWHRIYDGFFEAFQMFSNNFYRMHTSVQNTVTILLRVFMKLTSRSLCKSTVHMLYVRNYPYSLPKIVNLFTKYMFIYTGQFKFVLNLILFRFFNLSNRNHITLYNSLFLITS